MVVAVFVISLLLSPLLSNGQGVGNTSRPTFPCGGQLSGQQGHVASEGFPAPYPPNKKCSWTIQVPAGRVVMLSFRHLDVESDMSCRYDHVSVYAGQSPAAPLLGRYCGTIRPGGLVTTGNTAHITMETDADHNGRGFLVTYIAGLPPNTDGQFCGGRLVKPQGSIKTPNWPEKPYPTGVSCTWHIVSRANEVIELTFDKFGLEGDAYCRYDYVAVYNGAHNDRGRQLGKYCGDKAPGPLVSLGNEMLVQFVSDLSVPADGFVAKYHVRLRPGANPDTPIAPTLAPHPRVPDRGGPRVAPTRAPRKRVRPVSGRCPTKCRRKGSLQSNFCASNFVISAQVQSLTPQGAGLLVTVSVLHTYKPGGLTQRQVGTKTLARFTLECRRCPQLRKGSRYTLMGAVDRLGRGRLLPSSFVLVYKEPQHRVLTKLTKRRC